MQCRLLSGAHNPKQTTLILGLELFFPRKWKLFSVLERIRSKSGFLLPIQQFSSRPNRHELWLNFKIIGHFFAYHCDNKSAYCVIPRSVGCLWHSHGKNPVRLYPKLQSQPIGLRKVFIDYLFFQADQSYCTKSVSTFNRFASSEER